MAGFKKFYFLMTVLTAAAAATASFGCGFNGEGSSSSTETTAKSTAENFTPTVVKTEEGQTEDDRRESSAAARNRIRKGVEKRTLFDGSEYVAMRDGYGNKIEYRYFEPESGVKYISLQTTVDGTTSIQVRTWDGFIKQINPEQIADPWRVSARDVAVLTGFPVEYQMKEKPAAATTGAAAVPVAPQRSPVVPLPETGIVSKQLEAPAVKTGKPAEESKPEQVLKPTETPRRESPDQSAALRRMLKGSH